MSEQVKRQHHSDQIYTISHLTREIKNILEGHFPQIWVTAEISNFHAHRSGHYYFTLKDKNAQIQAVMFRNANRNLKFKLENGLEIFAKAHVSVYEVRGNYQLILEYAEPKGLGSLQLAFEQLKSKLQSEGLFEEVHKKPLPFLPKNIGIITSPTGAAIQDMIKILHRRFPSANILLYPVSVQGETASLEIAHAIEVMNQQPQVEVLIIGRGGGSLEDLWAFNTEVVARAIFASKIPVVSAVGHETDVTISDFVADLRAPTPSAAAELVTPVQSELKGYLQEQILKLIRRLRQKIDSKRQELKFWNSHLKHPKHRLEEKQIHLDDLKTRLTLAAERQLFDQRTRLSHLSEKLQVLSPLNTLARGYAIVSNDQGQVLREIKDIEVGKTISIELQKGQLKARVTQKNGSTS